MVRKNWIKLTSSQVTQLGLSSLTFLVIARSLGPEKLGPLTAAVAMNQIALPLVDMGFSMLLQRGAARNPEDFAWYWGRTLTAFAICATVLTAAICVLGSFMIKPASVWPALGLVVVADILLRGLVSLASVACQARHAFGHMAVVDLMPPLMTLVAALLWAFVFHQASLMSWLAWYLVSALFSVVLALGIVRRQVPPPKFGGRVTRKMLGEAFLFVLAPLAQNVNNNADKVILSNMASASVLGSYGLAYRIVFIALLPVQSLHTMFVWQYFRAGSGGAVSAYRVALQRLPPNLFLGLVSSAPIFIFAPLIAKIFGGQFSELAVMIRWLALIPVLKAVQLTFANVLSASQNQGSRVAVQLAVAVASIVLTIALVPRWGWQGAAVASLMSDALLAGLLVGAVKSAVHGGRG